VRKFGEKLFQSFEVIGCSLREIVKDTQLAMLKSVASSFRMDSATHNQTTEVIVQISTWQRAQS